MIIYLLRHGYSTANYLNLVTGTPKDELTNIGSSGAEKMRTWFLEAKIEPDAFFVSHWMRARQTAEILFPNAPWMTDMRIGETDAGEVADQPLDQFISSWPDFYNSPENSYPGGESHAILNNRVQDFLGDIIELNKNSILIVAHAGPISCILQKVMNMDMCNFPAFIPAHSSLSIIEYRQHDSSGGNRFRLKGFSIGPLSIISGYIRN